MKKQHSHCSYCGAPFPEDMEWPLRCRACGSTTYRNPIPVVVTLLPVKGGLVGVRRGTEPEKGKIALPGGYLDYGERWQDGARRELREETGIDVAAEDIGLYDVQTAPDGTIVVFGLAQTKGSVRLDAFSSPEIMEVTVIDEQTELCFELHRRVVGRYFAGRARVAD